MKMSVFPLAFLFLFLQFSGAGLGQISTEAQREALRLERMAGRVWESLLEEARYGARVDQRTRLDVFNFVNGVRALKEKVESGRVRTSDLAGVLELVQLQAKDVDRSLRGGRLGKFVMRDWNEARSSLDSLARLVSPRERRPARSERAGGRAGNVNDLRVEIAEVRRVGNFFKNEYRIRGTISGRNIVSAGLYAQGELIKSISVRLHERRLSENPFALRLSPPEGKVEIRVIDSQGFVLEEPIEFPDQGLIPKF